MIQVTLRKTLGLALCAALYAPAAPARQDPAPEHLVEPAAPRAADLSGEFSRLFPDTTAFYAEIPHVASLVASIGGGEALLEKANAFLAGPPAKDPKDAKGPKPAARPAPVLTAKDLGTLLDASAAVGMLSAEGAATPSAAVLVLHMNGADGPALLRDRIFARFGTPLATTKAHGVEVTRLQHFSYVVSGRSVLVGLDDTVEAVLAVASSDGRRLGDEPGFVSASAKHATGQDQVFAYASGRAISSTFGGMFGVRAQRADGKPDPYEAAVRSLVGLEAIQGFAAGVRFEAGAVKVRYDFELDRSRTGLVTTLADPPPIEFHAASRLPADTERLTVLSLDATRIFDLVEQAFAPLPPPRNGESFASQVAEVEANIGASLRGELLPAFGTELAYTGTVDGIFGGGMPLEDGAKPPLSVLVVDVRNPEVLRKVISKVLTIKPDAPPLSPVDYKGAELWDVPGTMAVALGKDFALVGTGADLRRCLDARADGTVLAKAPEYAAKAGTWAGDTLFATYESSAYREAAERAEAKRLETLGKRAGGENFDDFMMMTSLSGALTATVPAAILRDGSGVHWETSAPLAPLAGLVSYVVEQVLRDATAAPREPDGDTAMIGLLRLLTSAQASFQSQHERFGTLEELSEADFLDGKSVGETLAQAGYRLAVMPEGTGEGARFEIVATPATYGKPGKLSFFVDESYIIRAADKQGAQASAADTPLSYGGDEDYAVSPTHVTAVDTGEDGDGPAPDVVPDLAPEPEDLPPLEAEPNQ